MDSEGDQLGVDEGQGNPGVRDQSVVAARHIRQVLKVLPRVTPILSPKPNSVKLLLNLVKSDISKGVFKAVYS